MFVSDMEAVPGEGVRREGKQDWGRPTLGSSNVTFFFSGTEPSRKKKTKNLAADHEEEEEKLLHRAERQIPS